MNHGTATPYIASYIIFRNNNKIAFLLRSQTTWMNGHYGLPSGKVEDNESYLACAIREAKEEVGVDLKAEDLEPVLTIHRHEDQDWVDVYFEAHKWQGELYNAEPHKHGELAWLDPARLPKNVVPSVRYSLEQLSTGKHYTEYGWEHA